MNRTVLIADDDPAIRSLLRACLTDPFTTCAEAADGEAAVRMAGQTRPDAILLDVDMPSSRLDGFAVCRSLKSDPATRRIPVVFLTSHADVTDKVRGLDLGAADYVTKPFDPDELQARVRSALRARRDLRQVDTRAARDEVTGLFNRAYLAHRVEAELATSRRHGRPLACCVAAVGGWDDLVAARGRAAADDVARAVAAGVLSVLRREDVACRYDDATVAVLAFTGDPAAAMLLGHRLQAAVAAAVAGVAGPAAVNVGVALSHQSAGDSLLWHAGEALRHATLTAKGTVQFGGELTELHLTGGPVN